MPAEKRATSAGRWLDRNFLALGREMRLSYLPPLMVYVAAGISGLTAIVGTFFVKEYLGLSVEFLAALGFSITVAAGMVAHWRNYWTEPYIWGTGIFLSTTTQYLRIAADKHYFSDVLVGGALGIAGGLLIPRLMREDVPIVPIKNGVAWVGEF